MSDSPNRGAVLLREWRRAQGLTQFRAAAHIGVEQSPYCKYELGRTKPGRKVAVRIEERTAGAVPVAAWDREINRKKVA